jgi:hypothetical protein
MLESYEDRESLERHLAECGACRAEDAWNRRVGDAIVSALGSRRAPEADRRAVLARARPRRRGWVPAVAAGLLAALAIVVAVAPRGSREAAAAVDEERFYRGELERSLRAIPAAEGLAADLALVEACAVLEQLHPGAPAPADVLASLASDRLDERAAALGRLRRMDAAAIRDLASRAQGRTRRVLTAFVNVEAPSLPAEDEVVVRVSQWVMGRRFSLRQHAGGRVVVGVDDRRIEAADIFEFVERHGAIAREHHVVDSAGRLTVCLPLASRAEVARSLERFAAAWRTGDIEAMWAAAGRLHPSAAALDLSRRGAAPEEVCRRIDQAAAAAPAAYAPDAARIDRLMGEVRQDPRECRARARRMGRLFERWHRAGALLEVMR